MEMNYTLAGSLTDISAEIGAYLKEKHSSTLFLDTTYFSGENCDFQVDTYQVLNLSQKGYITINVYLSRADMLKNELQVKVSLFSPYWNGQTHLMEKLQKELHAFMVSHGGVPQQVT